MDKNVQGYSPQQISPASSFAILFMGAIAAALNIAIHAVVIALLWNILFIKLLDMWLPLPFWAGCIMALTWLLSSKGASDD